MNHYLIDTKLIAYFLKQRGGSVLQIFNKIAEILWMFPKGKIYLGFDLGKSSYRVGLYKAYKGHRASRNAKLSEAEKEENRLFEEMYRGIFKYAHELPVTVLGIQGVEADDLLSLKVEELKEDLNNNIYLVTGDMDYVNSVVGTPNVRIIDVLNNNTVIDSTYVKDKYGEQLNSRHRFNVHKSIFGDKSDNIKFLRNMGKVKAQEVFDIIYTSYEVPTNEQIVEIIYEYVKKYPNIKIHEFHKDEGRETIHEVFLANMKLADTFRTTENFTEEQLNAYNNIMSRVPLEVAYENELYMKSIEIFNMPIVLDDIAKRVFNVR